MVAKVNRTFGILNPRRLLLNVALIDQFVRSLDLIIEDLSDLVVEQTISEAQLDLIDCSDI